MLDLYIAYTPYHLFIINQIINEENDNYLLIVDNGTQLYNSPILVKNYFKEIYIEKDVSKIKGTRNIFLQLKKYKGCYKRFSKVNNLYLFLDNNITGQIIIETFKQHHKSVVNLLEDGIGLYRSKMRSQNESLSFQQKLKRLLFRTFFLSNFEVIKQGENKKVDNIFCNHPNVLDDPRSVNLKSIIRNEHSYPYDAQEVEVLLITQPLSEDGETSLQEEIDLYKNILEHIDANKKVAFKLHPRESKEKYQFLHRYPNVIILDDTRFPLEAIIYNIKCEYMISICSTALLTCNNEFIKQKFYVYPLINLKHADEYSIISRFIDYKEILLVQAIHGIII